MAMTRCMADEPDKDFRLSGHKTLTRWCSRCRANREITLPAHPAGIGVCSSCGGWHDLFDYNQTDRAEYLAQYEEV